MLRGKTFLCVIPARGGSTRLKNKNIKLLCGKPLIYWAITAAKKADIFDDIVVNSNDDEILRTANFYGVSIYKRPPELATTDSYVGDAMKEMLSRRPKYDYVQLIEPTCPLLRPEDIKKAAKFCLEKDADMVISVSESTCPSGLSKPVPKDLCLTGWFPEELRTKNSQNIPLSYQVNGAIYLSKWFIWADGIDYWKTRIYAYIMGRHSTVDINDIYDFNHAEDVLRARNERPVCGNIFSLRYWLGFGKN